MLSCSGCLFFHVSLQIDFNLLPKSTFNFMEGQKLCTAFVSVTILKTCEKKNWQHVTLNLVLVMSQIREPPVSEMPGCGIWQRFPFFFSPLLHFSFRGTSAKESRRTFRNLKDLQIHRSSKRNRKQNTLTSAGFWPCHSAKRCDICKQGEFCTSASSTKNRKNIKSKSQSHVKLKTLAI